MKVASFIKHIFKSIKESAKKKEKEKKKQEVEKVIQIGFVTYRCKVCGFRTGSRKEIRQHILKKHKKQVEGKRIMELVEREVTPFENE